MCENNIDGDVIVDKTAWFVHFEGNAKWPMPDIGIGNVPTADELLIKTT